MTRNEKLKRNVDFYCVTGGRDGGGGGSRLAGRTKEHPRRGGGAMKLSATFHLLCNWSPRAVHRRPHSPSTVLTGS